jgi:hypothetical protein
MLIRVAAVGGIVTTTLLVAPAAAWADGWGQVGCGQASTPHCELTAGASASPQIGAPGPQVADQQANSSGGGSVPSCHYSESSGSPGASGWQPPGSWYEGTCSLTGAIHNPDLQLSPAETARLARAQLGLPEPAPAANPAGTQLVNLPTWLWLTSGWETITATASVPGVTVTATAHPVSVTWATGDGAIVSCSGSGTAFRAGGDPRSPSPDCGHTYRRSSAAQPGGAYAVAVTVHWSVTWAGAGQSGTFPEMTTSISTSFRVAESQALNTLPGPR